MSKMILSVSLFALMACNNSNTDGGGSDSTSNQTDSSSVSGSTTSEWTSLFDGNSLNSWHAYGKSGIGSSWKVDSGTIHFVKGDSINGGDIVTNEEFENFHLKLDWKISPKGNSGIMFLVKEDTAYQRTYHTGPEMQVLDNNGHADAKIPKHRAGDLYDLIASSKETVKPVGEWNHVEIVLNKGKLDFFLNGENIVSTTMWDDNWNKMVAGSKFKEMPGFAKFRSGRIALQDHGDEVWYKDISIKKL